MRVEMGINTNELYRILQSGGQKECEKLLDVLKYLDGTEHCHALSLDKYGEICEYLFKHRHNDWCKELNQSLNRVYAKNGERRLEFDDGKYQEIEDTVKRLEIWESTDLKQVLYGRGQFSFDHGQVLWHSGSVGLRHIFSCSDAKKLLAVLSSTITEEKQFAQRIQIIYPELVFDPGLSDSLKTLRAGLRLRAGEILYHLYCIDNEIPALVKLYSRDVEVGEHMSIPCSPERSRKTVEDELTVSIGSEKVRCEMHTKMEIVSTDPPDRVYFCKSVKDGVKDQNGKDLTGKIYIYKIGRHAANNKKH